MSKPIKDLREYLGNERAKNRRETIARLERAFTGLRGPFPDDRARDDFRRRAGDLAEAVFDQVQARMFQTGALPMEPLYTGLQALFDGREIPRGCGENDAAHEV